MPCKTWPKNFHLRFLLRAQWFFWRFFFFPCYRGQATGWDLPPSDLSQCRESGPGLNGSWESETSAQPQLRPQCYWKSLQGELTLSFAMSLGKRKEKGKQGKEVRPGDSGPPAKRPINQSCSSSKAIRQLPSSFLFQWKEMNIDSVFCSMLGPFKWVWLGFPSLVGGIWVFRGNYIFSELSLWVRSLVRCVWEYPGVTAGHERGPLCLRWCQAPLQHPGGAGFEPESS